MRDDFLSYKHADAALAAIEMFGVMPGVLECAVVKIGSEVPPLPHRRVLFVASKDIVEESARRVRLRSTWIGGALLVTLRTEDDQLPEGHKTSSPELLESIDAIGEEIESLEAGCRDEDTDKRIVDLEMRAAELIRLRGELQMQKIQSSIDAALTRAEELLRSK